jgi:hypothetical protein
MIAPGPGPGLEWCRRLARRLYDENIAVIRKFVECVT